MHACSRSMGTNGLKRSRGGCSDFWRITRMGLRMHSPFSFITKRVDVSMGCPLCESHDFVMVAVAVMRLGQGMRIRVFFGPWLLAKEIRPRARRFQNPVHVITTSWLGCVPPAAVTWSRRVVGRSRGLHLAAVAACCRHAVASSDARGMRGHAIAACRFVFRRVRLALKKFAYNE